MYKKQYGRMTVGAWLNCEMNRTSPPVMILLGVMLAVGGILVRAFVGGPHRTILELGIVHLIPPVWLMAVLWTVAFFTVGCAAGFVLGMHRGGYDGERYKGCMLFVLLAVLELCWYPTFFGAGLYFLSVLESILILCLSLAVTFCFYRVSKFAGMLFFLHDVWLIYMLILNFSAFFV